MEDLVLDTYGYSLRKDHRNVVVNCNKKQIRSVPFGEINSITVPAKGFMLSSNVVSECAYNNIPIFFASGADQIVAVAEKQSPAGIELLSRQVKASESGPAMHRIATGFVRGKIRNQMHIVQYFFKYRKALNPAESGEKLGSFLRCMHKRLDELKHVSCEQAPAVIRGKLFGIEGRAATQYWNMVGHLLGDIFPGRKHRNADDQANAMLNYCYALLARRIHQSILRAGLHPEIAFLHGQEKGRHSLVYDLIEEFRAPIADRIVFACFGSGKKRDSGGGRLSEAVCRKLRESFHKNLQRLVVRHGKRRSMEAVLDRQAQTVAECLRKGGVYRPYLFKW